MFKLKTDASYELGKGTGIFLPDVIIKPILAFTENEAVISLLFFNGEAKTAFKKQDVKLTKEELDALTQAVGEIFVIEDNLVSLNPDTSDKLISLLQIDGEVLGEKFEICKEKS